jgi:Taurine catabolism dioxygenase TauD, TfdA family
MRSLVYVTALALADAMLGIVQVVASTIPWNGGCDNNEALASVLFERPVADVKTELKDKGYSLTKVSDVIQALEHLHLVLPVDDKDDQRSVEPFYYSGGYFSRRTIGDSGFVYDVGPSNPNLTLAPHNEMGYGPRTPRYIAFGAKLAATGGGGDTMLLDGHQVFSRLQDRWQQVLKTRKIRYRLRFDGFENGFGGSKNSTVSNLLMKKPQQTSWHHSFGCNTPHDAIETALAMGYHQGRVMDGSDSIQTIYDSPAVVQHPHTRQPCMLEQIVGAHGSALDQEEQESLLQFMFRLHHTTWAPILNDKGAILREEEELETDFLENLDHVAADLLVRVPIPSGHVLVVDNIWHKHGRLKFQGDREMLVTMRGTFRGTANGR